MAHTVKTNSSFGILRPDNTDERAQKRITICLTQNYGQMTIQQKQGNQTGSNQSSGENRHKNRKQNEREGNKPTRVVRQVAKTKNNKARRLLEEDKVKENNRNRCLSLFDGQLWHKSLKRYARANNTQEGAQKRTRIPP